MNCVVPDSAIKAFGKAVQCLAKFGDEVYIEASSSTLCLKTVNAARSAFVCYTFSEEFFLFFKLNSSNRSGIFSCRVLMKPLMAIFRALSSLEKTVQCCKMTFIPAEYHLVIVFDCKHGIVKTHQLGYNDCESLKAIYCKETCPNKILGAARPLSETIVNFPNNLDEVTLIVKVDKLLLKTHVGNPEDIGHVPMTEVCFNSNEFEKYRINRETELTFCLKEMRAVLSYCEALGDTLALIFESPGKPIIMSIENNDQYSMDMVMATLAGEDGDNSQQTTQHTTPTRHVHHPNTSSNTTARANTTDSTDRTITTTDRTITTTAGASNATDRTGNDYGQEKGSPPQVRRERIKEHSKATSIDSGCVSGTMSSLRLGNDGADDDDDLMDTLFSVDDTAVLSHTHASTNKRGLDYCDKGLDDPPRTDIHPFISQEDELDSSSFIPATPPPTKKHKSMFSVLDIIGYSQSVLAPDSEDED